jgi:hypothetical protein
MSILRYKQKLLPLGNPQGGGGGFLGIGGGGGSSAPSQQTASQSNQYANISPWAQPYVSNLLSGAQSQVFQTDSSGNITGINPYQAYGMNGAGMSPAAQQAAQASVAGFTPLQNQAFQGAANLQTPDQFGQATGAAGMGTMQSLMAGQNLANQSTNPYAVGAYMNPYIQNSLNPQLQLLAQQTGINSAAEQGAATSRGAFGGSREALMNSLNQQAGNLAAQQAIGQGYNTAFTNAQNQMNQVASLGLQGAAQGISGANTLANIGTGQLAAQQGILGLQNQYGTQQQQQQQNIINQAMQNYATAQQYPMSQLQQLSSLAQPYITKDVTTTQQAAAPSTAATLAGVGTAGIAGLGLYNAMNKS